MPYSTLLPVAVARQVWDNFFWFGPRVLFEVGFLTNPEDADRLASREGQEELADFVAQAIRVFFARQSTD